MFSRSALALALTAATLPALAEEAKLVAPIEAGVLSDGGIDMVTYYTAEADGAYLVTATWVSDSDAEPRRLVMRLQPGEGATFALPGHAGTLFGFSREADVISVKSTPVRSRTASL